MRRTAALIVGGGPAGSAAAIVLGRAGLAPLLVERSAGERDVVCGGFLGWDALAALSGFGLDAAALGAQPIHRLRLVGRGRIVEAELPHPAAGLSRRRLDARLLELAGAAGAQVLRGRAARGIEGLRVRLDDGEEIEAEALFVATGKHELRGCARDTGERGLAIGLRAALPPEPALSRALAGTIELHLFDEGYAGLLLQEDGSANFCLSASRSRLGAVGTPEALVARLIDESPVLGERLGSLPSRWDAIAGVPYGWRTRSTTPGIFRLGDQAAVIASLAGDGVAIALNSGIAAAQAHMAGGAAAADDFQRRFAARAARPVRLAELLRNMAEHRSRRGWMMRLAGSGAVARLAARLTRIG